MLDNNKIYKGGFKFFDKKMSKLVCLDKLVLELRNNNIDVLNSDDADHYNYTHTLIISRKGNIQILKEVSSLLEIDIKDKNHVLNNPVSDSDVDLTVIIGSDYTSIKPVMEFLDNQN